MHYCLIIKNDFEEVAVAGFHISAQLGYALFCLSSGVMMVLKGVTMYIEHDLGKTVGSVPIGPTSGS